MTQNVPSLKTLNGSFLDIDEKKQVGRLRFEPTQDMCNPRGFIQGGFVTAMLDDAAGLVCFISTQREFTTSNLHIDFFHGTVPGEPVIATATMVRAGLRQAIVDVELIRESDDKLLARGTVYQIFLDTQKKP